MDDRDVAIGRRRTGGYRLPRRAGPQEEDEENGDHGDGDDGDGGDPGRSRLAGDSQLGALLRSGHGARLPRSLLDVYAAEQGAGVLAWIERNRVWLIPWISALIVMVIEVLAALFASRPIPLEGHVALGAFWAFAVSRGSLRVQSIRASEARLREYAEQRGIPLAQAQTEWEVFEAQVAQQALPGGDDDGE